jgi:hypothetical protein
MSSAGYSAPNLNAVLYPQRVLLPIQYKLGYNVQQPAADYNGCLAHLFGFELAESGVAACCIRKKRAKLPLKSAGGCHTRPDHLAE